MALMTVPDFLLLELVRSGTVEDPENPERFLRTELRRDPETGMQFTMRFPMSAKQERVDALLPAPA